MKLKRLTPGHYETDDGHFNVERHDDYESECRCIYCRGDAGFGNSLKCQSKSGDGVVYDSRWIVWDNETQEYACSKYQAPGPNGFRTKSEAVAWLRRHIYAEA